MKKAVSILLVEDDRDDQEIFVLALKGIKNATLYDVVGNGKEALDRLKYALVFPDLIFSDINMPLMNGIEYLSKMSNDPRTRSIPIIMLTSDMYTKELALKLGAKSCIKKTSDEIMLREQVEQMVGLTFPLSNQRLE